MNAQMTSAEKDELRRIEAALDSLVQVAGQLEEIACALEIGTQCQSTAVTQALVEEALLFNIATGKEAFATADIVDAVSCFCESRGQVSSVLQVRRMLPPLMLKLFNSKPSCSIKTEDGRYVRGFRGLSAR